MLFSANKHHLKIHQTLNRNGFYRLPLHKLVQILNLLGMPVSREAKYIQEYAIKGLEKILQRQKKSFQRGFPRQKRYFNEGSEQEVSVEVKNYVTFIVDELLDSQQNELQESFQMPSPFPFISLNYPNFQSQYPPEHSKKQISQQMQQRMKSQIQMYYMNMYNMNSPLNQYYNQEGLVKNKQQKKNQIQQEPINKSECEKQPINEVPKVVDDLKRIQESYESIEENSISVKNKEVQSAHQEQNGYSVKNDEIIEKIQQVKQPIQEIRNEQKMIDENNQLVEDAQIEANLKIVPPIEQRDNLMNEVKLIKQNSITHKQLQLKSVSSIHNNDLDSPPQPALISMNNIQAEDIPKRKVQQAEIQIQTDLTLINQQIQVTPRNSYLKKKIKKEKRKQEHERRVAHQDQQAQKTFIGKYPVQQQFIQTEKGKKKDYVLTINKFDLLGQQNSIEQAPNQLPRLQSEIQIFKAKISEQLKQISNAITSAQQFSNCFCKGKIKDLEPSFQCYLCNKNYHCSCVSISNEQSKQACPFCRLLNVDPIHEVKQTIKTVLIENISKKEVAFQVNLSHYEYYLIRRMRSHDIQLRCLKIGANLQYSEITWPDEVQLYVNDRKIVEFPALHCQSSLRKRRDYPIAITHFIFGEANQSQDGYRHVQIRLKMKQIHPSQYKFKHINNDFKFLLGIYFIEKIKQEELTKMYYSSLRKYPFDFLQELLSTEGQVQIQKIVCTLFDPFSKKMINTPVRGINCNHGQCFDLNTYIDVMYNMQNRNWKCPICSKETKQFYIDSQFVQLIKKSKREKIVPSQITFTKEGKVLLKVVDEVQEQHNNSNFIIKAKKDKKRKIQKIPQSHQQIEIKVEQNAPYPYIAGNQIEIKDSKLNIQCDQSN